MSAGVERPSIRQSFRSTCTAVWRDAVTGAWRRRHKRSRVTCFPPRPLKNNASSQCDLEKSGAVNPSRCSSPAVRRPSVCRVAATLLVILRGAAPLQGHSRSEVSSVRPHRRTVQPISVHRVRMASRMAHQWAFRGERSLLLLQLF